MTLYKIVNERRIAMTPAEEAAFELSRAPKPPTTDMIAFERARRLAVGFDYDFKDARGVHRIGTTKNDLEGWDEVTKLSSALIATGASGDTITINTNTGTCDVTALEWQSVVIAVGAFRQQIWHASFKLQAMNPKPVDFRDDRRWAA